MDTRKPIAFPQPDQFGFTNDMPNKNRQQAQTRRDIEEFRVNGEEKMRFSRRDGHDRAKNR
jgi:hypothetical protein